MIVDNDYVICYVNQFVVILLCNQQSSLCEVFFDFDVDYLIGSSIYCFYVDFDCICGIFNIFSKVYYGCVWIGLVYFVQVVILVFDVCGQCFGFVVEWYDCIQEFLLENVVVGIVVVVIKGDFDQCLFVSNSGVSFFDSLIGGINYLFDSVGGIVGEICCVFFVFVEGDLDQCMQGEFDGLFVVMQCDVNVIVVQFIVMVEWIKQCIVLILLVVSEIVSGNSDFFECIE